ncbi:MAG TPA: quinone oxidoreductase [Steroidobacteraceae bacterium]|nr:quinone oxidoreductase [Steroidobacteraceae bacterium]
MALGVMLREIGGPEMLRVEAVAVGTPGPDEVRLRQTVIGVNFHDTYVLSGLYKTLQLPGIPGVEAVGVVEAVGERVTDLKRDDRVGYVTGAYGAYASERLIRADRLIRLPRDLDDRTLGAVLVKALTVVMLLTKLRPLKSGDTCLVHAAAGGVGSLLCQWAHHLGARVIGTAGSDQKAAIALKNGCDHVVLYKQESFPQRVRELTQGRGVDVAYDGVGKDTFSGSLESLAMRGHLINFGQSSGAVEPFLVSRLVEKSNTLSRPILFHYIEDRRERQEIADAAFDALRKGVISAAVGGEFRLKDVAAAHRALESRATTGSTILIP